MLLKARPSRPSLSESWAADGDGVEVDVAAGRAAVAVGDGPGGAREALGGAALGGVVEGLAVDGAARGLGAEDPEVAGARVEVQVQGLRRGADGHGVVRLSTLSPRMRATAAARSSGTATPYLW
ncbi:hypothetical protein VTK73DRAFT_9452 [Phialemonium thermophilum]|uniref:Uncharacterized protein n=1 Tax=Phialemonium thermophilum TaxID=223376 RepID=A0ABR3W265_9PEZI